MIQFYLSIKSLLNLFPQIKKKKYKKPNKIAVLVAIDA